MKAITQISNDLRNLLSKISLSMMTQFIIWGVIVLGVWARVHQYLFDRSLWLDEACLALNIIQKNPFELLTAPLDNNQAAPYGFLLVIKLLVNALGNNTLVLRVFPFASGVISIFVFKNLLQRISSRKVELLALSLFCISLHLIYYTSELKPYIIDVFVGLILTNLIISVLVTRLDGRLASWLAVVGSFSIWFSFPSVFILASIGILLAAVCISNKDWAAIWKVVLVGIVWVVSFFIYYVVFLKHTSNNSALNSFWAFSFIPWPINSLENLRRFVNLMVGVFVDPGNLCIPGMALVFFVVGAVRVFRRSRWIFLVLILPLILTMIASSLQRYPFAGRLLLFYMPYLYVLITEGFGFILEFDSKVKKILAVIIVVIFFFQPVVLFGNVLSKPLAKERIKQVLKYVSRNAKENDILYLYPDAIPAFDYYASKYQLGSYKVLRGVGSRVDWTLFYPELDSLTKYGRAWIIFSHVYNDGASDQEEYIVAYLNHLGTIKLKYHTSGASCYLYVFTPKP